MIISFFTLSLMLLLLVCCFGLAGLRRLATLRLHGGWLVLLACSAQVAGLVTQQYQLPLLLVSAVLLVQFCWLNRRHVGIVIATVGIALNMLVMAANGGVMPVSAATIAQVAGPNTDSVEFLPLTKGVIVDDSEAVLPWLGDRLLLPGPLASIAAWSIGDVFLLAGVGWLLWRTMKGHAYDRHTLWDGATSS